MNIFSIHNIKIISLTTLFVLLAGCASGGGPATPGYYDHWDDDFYYRNGFYNSHHSYPVYVPVPGKPRPPVHLPDRPRPPARPRPPTIQPIPRSRPRAR